jgi:endonuclease/exonuclease/phosphatase family metal-dependent hydrolase
MGVAVMACLAAGIVWAEPVQVRVTAANLTSGNHQAYAPDEGANAEGAGARILKGLKPDVALVQEFNTTVPARQWVDATFGKEFSFFVEADAQIPNGIVSRFPIVESGEWHDAEVPNRDFAWARIALPNGRSLWAVSVHLYSQKPDVRAKEAEALLKGIRSKIPEADLVVLGGDFNTAADGERCLSVFGRMFDTKVKPVDQAGDADTNAKRSKPYDRVLADEDLAALAVPVRVGAVEFPKGLVFDSRMFEPLADVAPVRKDDSAVPNMQHMAVVRDFAIP